MNAAFFIPGRTPQVWQRCASEVKKVWPPAFRLKPEATRAGGAREPEAARLAEARSAKAGGFRLQAEGFERRESPTLASTIPTALSTLVLAVSITKRPSAQAWYSRAATSAQVGSR